VPPDQNLQLDVGPTSALETGWRPRVHVSAHLKTGRVRVVSNPSRLQTSSGYATEPHITSEAGLL
jgi:hypothetical protein